MQYEPWPQRGPSSLQAAIPVGHAGGAPPPQLGSGSVRPTQISQASQGFRHEGTWVHGWHTEGSSSVSSVQPEPLGFSEPSHTKRPLAAGSSQQPKQSQPFGTSGPQVAAHIGS